MCNRTDGFTFHGGCWYMGLGVVFVLGLFLGMVIIKIIEWGG